MSEADPGRGGGEEASVLESYRYARRLTLSQARNFAYAFWFLTPERRRSISVVYAYSRRLDDCVDSAGGGPSDQGPPDQVTARRGLERLRALLDGAGTEGADGGAPGGPPDPLAPALRDTIRRFSIPLAPFHELIAGMEMDLERRRYPAFEDLRLYCYRAASTVGLICISIFGNDGPAAHAPAVDLGIAMQLTNVLRDIPEDFRRGRIYLPQEDLLRFGYREEDLARGVVDRRFRDLMQFQVGRAREYFASARSLLPHLSRESRRCPALLAAFYQAILDRIERAGYDVFRRRPRLSLARKLVLAGAQVFRRADISLATTGRSLSI